MDPSALLVLERLLTRAERRAVKDQTGSGPVSTVRPLSMTPASCPEYTEINSVEGRDVFHSTIRSAARAGAVTPVWDRRAGDERQLTHVELADATKLAAFLGRTAHWDLVESAQLALRHCHVSMVHWQPILNAWRSGKRPRGYGPEHVKDLLDALKVIERPKASADEDELQRAVSVQLFGDSKRLEALVPLLDILTSPSLASVVRDPADVLLELGLVREALPVLATGCGRVVLSDGTALPIGRPYIGFSGAEVKYFDQLEDLNYVLSIENLTTFHQVSRALTIGAPALVLFSAGNVSRSFLACYRALLRALGPGIPLFHWGDIDRGGFLAARRLQGVCQEAGARLLPWLMDPRELGDVVSHPLDDRQVAEVARQAEALGWVEAAAGIRQRRIRVEQEALRVLLPQPPGPQRA